MDLVCLNTYDGKQGAIRAVRYNVDGTYSITCGADKKVKLWNPHKSLLLKTYGGHGNEVLDAAGSCDSSHIISCSADKSVILWDVGTGQPLRRLRSHAGPVTCVKFNEESTLAISGSQDNTVMCWDLRSRKQEPVQVMREAKDTVTSLQITDHEIISSSLDCRLRRYDLRVAEMVTDFLGEPVTSVALTRDGQCLLAGCSDSRLRLMDKSTGELLAEFTGHDTSDFTIECCILSTDSHVVSGSTQGCAVIWDLVSQKITSKLQQGGASTGGVIHSVTSHPTKEEILTACKGEVKIWGKADIDDLMED